MYLLASINKPICVEDLLSFDANIIVYWTNLRSKIALITNRTSLNPKSRLISE